MPSFRSPPRMSSVEEESTALRLLSQKREHGRTSQRKTLTFCTFTRYFSPQPRCFLCHFAMKQTLIGRGDRKGRSAEEQGLGFVILKGLEQNERNCPPNLDIFGLQAKLGGVNYPSTLKLFQSSRSFTVSGCHVSSRWMEHTGSGLNLLDLLSQLAARSEGVRAS